MPPPAVVAAHDGTKVQHAALLGFVAVALAASYVYPLPQACLLPPAVVAAHVGTYLQHTALLGEVAVALEVSYA